MGGFNILKKDAGIVVYKPIGFKKYQLCIKKGNTLKHIAVIKDDKYAEELKATLIMLGIGDV